MPWFLFDLQELSRHPGNWLFAVNRIALTSFQDRDHGARDSTSFRDWLAGLMAERGLHNLHFKVLCLPRLLGYVFNPISVVYCFDYAQNLVGMVYEVQNTFGESHPYVHVFSEPCEKHSARKELHVSPFFSMHGQYQFEVTAPEEKIKIGIQYRDDGGTALFAGFSGKRLPFDTRHLIQVLVTAPFLALAVTADIHWQALRLWMKGLPVFHKPDYKSKQDIQHG
jgi:uncharacterized protein